MSNPYREIFRAPGAKGFSAAGFFARLPIAMAPIGIVAMLSQTHGEYWLAGAVSATFALTNAVISPQISRQVCGGDGGQDRSASGAGTRRARERRLPLQIPRVRARDPLAVRRGVRLRPRAPCLIGGRGVARSRAPAP